MSTCPILCDMLPTMETPIIDSFVFFTNDIAMILRRAPPKEKRKLKTISKKKYQNRKENRVRRTPCSNSGG